MITAAAFITICFKDYSTEHSPILPMIPAWISIYNHNKAQVEITYHFPNVNGAAVEVQNG